MENKKRKEKEDESDEELDEEKKMDKFYSLLRSFREARDRRRRELEELDRKKKKKTKGKTETTSSPPSIWVPSFESGDFTTEVEFRRPPLIFPSPYNPISSTSTSATTSPSNPCDVKHKGNKLQDQHQHDVLDLNLNLAL